MTADPLTYAIPLVVLLLAGFGALAFTLWRAWSAMADPRDVWRQLQGCGVPVYYVPAAWVDEHRLARCINLAVDLIRECGPWEAGLLASALSGLRIAVEPARDTHTSLHDRGFGFVRPPADVSVDVGLVELAHELIHLVEHRVDRQVDRAHVGWGIRGLTRGELSYCRALSSTQNARRTTP